MSHSTIGAFNTKGRLVSGGHSQKNINHLEKNNVPYNVEKTYVNGVRVGNIPSHKKTRKQSGCNQSWFPKHWSDAKIKRAGQVVARGEKLDDGQTKFGHYGRVNVGIKRTNGEISTIFPASKQLTKKGVEVREHRKTKRTNR
jgi:L-aminopeptidase/D-esterase-like protein